MVSSLIPNHHDMDVVVDFFCQLIQEYVNDIRVQVRTDKSCSFTRLGAGGAQYVDPIVTGLFDRRRARPFGSPYSCDRALLTESCFILKPNFDAFVGMLGFDRNGLFYDSFLNSSCVRRSVFSCFGRGISHE